MKGLLLDWFGSYLEEKKQRVDLKFPKFHNPSNWHIVKHGFPQGSVLDHLLFSLYINDFSYTNKLNYECDNVCR